MAELLRFLADQGAGVAVLLGAVTLAAAVLNWIMWMFGWGRFRPDFRPGSNPQSGLRFVLANFFVEIVNDFRHLLALVIAFLFAVTLLAATGPGLMAGDVDSIKDGLQAAAAALGGLMGSIIGYYFGESAASKKQTPPPAPPPAPPPVQAEPEITPARTPPNAQE